MKENIIPTLVLTFICAAASLLLVLAHEMTKENIAEQKENKFSTSVEMLFGKTDITLLDTNFGSDDIEAIAVTPDGKTAVQVITDGYSKDGINVLVGIDENGKISKIEFIALGETPGLGSKVKDNEEFREQFYGKSASPVELDAVSGATFSSNGMKAAVEEALDVYNNNKEAILSGRA